MARIPGQRPAATAKTPGHRASPVVMPLASMLLMAAGFALVFAPIGEWAAVALGAGLIAIGAYDIGLTVGQAAPDPGARARVAWLERVLLSASLLRRDDGGAGGPVGPAPGGAAGADGVDAGPAGRGRADDERGPAPVLRALGDPLPGEPD